MPIVVRWAVFIQEMRVTTINITASIHHAIRAAMRNRTDDQAGHRGMFTEWSYTHPHTYTHTHTHTRTHAHMHTHTHTHTQSKRERQAYDEHMLFENFFILQ